MIQKLNRVMNLIRVRTPHDIASIIPAFHHHHLVPCNHQRRYEFPIHNNQGLQRLIFSSPVFWNIKEIKACGWLKAFQQVTKSMEFFK